MAQSGAINQESKEVLQEERYLWMARAFSVISLLALIANILMLFALSGLTPLVRIQPFYLQTQSKERQVVSVIRPSLQEFDEKLIQESLVREYLLARYGIGSDLAELEKRWGPDGIIRSMSSASVYQEFYANESSKLLDLARIEGLTRDVKILRVNILEDNPSGRSAWRAEIEVTDMSQKVSDSSSNKYDINMEVMYTPTRKMSWAQRLINPLGFTVTQFGRKYSK